MESDHLGQAGLAVWISYSKTA